MIVQKRMIVVIYTAYILLVLFSAFYYSHQNNIKDDISNFTTNNNESGFVAVMKMLGEACKTAAESTSRLISYTIKLIISNILFFTFLMLIKHFSFTELLYLIGITQLLSFILFLLTVAVTEWSFDAYLTTAIPLLIATIYLSFETKMFNDDLIVQA